MIRPNMHYSELKDSYLFYNIAQKTKAYVEQHPGVKLLRMAFEDAFWGHVSTFQVTKYLLNSLSVLGPVFSIRNTEVNK